MGLLREIDNSQPAVGQRQVISVGAVSGTIFLTDEVKHFSLSGRIDHHMTDVIGAAMNHQAGHAQDLTPIHFRISF
jgi:hypothetical protein